VGQGDREAEVQEEGKKEAVMSDQEKMAEEIARLHLELEFEREAWELTIKSMLLYRNKFGWGEAEEEFMAKMQQEKRGT
jgi:hypothetical protein